MRRIMASLGFLLLLGLFLSLATNSAFAQALTVTSTNPAWQQVASSSGATFVLPATISGCGSENGTTCEPTGTFFFNQTWSGVPSYISIYDPDGTTLSDIITFDSTGPGSSLEVNFYSDPTLPASSIYSGYFQYASYTEGTNTGFVTTPLPVCCILNGNSLSVVIASDDEGGFDPFGAGYDTSDGIQFQGAVVATPEPGMLVLLGSGLLSFAGLLRRKLVAV